MVIGIDASRAFVEEPTGTERYSWEVISRMIALPEARKHQIILYTKSQISNPRLQTISKFQNIKIQKIGLPRLWTQVGLALRTWTDNLDVLWVPAHTLPVLRPAWAGLQRARPLRTVVTIHGIEYEWLPAYENKLQRWYLPLSTKYAVATATSVIAVSEYTKSQLVERLNAKPEKIEVIHEGFAVNDQITNRKNQTNYNIQILNKFNLQKKKYLIFVGTVQPRKNLERLVEAYQQIINNQETRNNEELSTTRQNPIKLVIAGKMGWGNEALLRKIQEQKSKNQIILTGYVSETERYTLLENALFYIQPSITEGFGLPVLEAWKAGLAVVSSNGGALSEILNPKSEDPNKKEYAGLLFDPYDVYDIEDKIRQLINNSKLRGELEKKGRERLRDFSWDKAAKETLTLLLSL